MSELELRSLLGSICSSDSEGERLEAFLEKLSNNDLESWNLLYETYSGLIYDMSRKAGLRIDEAKEVIQETMAGISKQLVEKERIFDSSKGTFKSWVCQIINWRIKDQLRKRGKDTAQKDGMVDFKQEGYTEKDVFDYLPDPNNAFENEWDNEHKKLILKKAFEIVKKRTSSKQFEIFDHYFIQELPVEKVVEKLSVTYAQVYLAKNRIMKSIRKEVAIFIELEL